MLSTDELSQISENPYKNDFPLLRSNKNLAFLDSAATTQRPEAVLDAMRDFYSTMNANPLRGLYSLSMRATSAIEDARATIARFIGANNPNEIVFTRNTSESLNLLAATLESRLNPNDEVVISIMEHHSNLIPWQQICERTGAKLVYLRLDENYEISDSELNSKIGANTKIVSLTHVSNVLGIKNDVKHVAEVAHSYGALVIVDGAQSIPHISIDVQDLDVDFFAFSAHKICGPMGIGVLWGRMNLLESLPPFLTGGEMIDSVSENSAVWAPVPQKFEAGTQDAAGIFAFAEAIRYMESKGMEQIELREQLLARYLVDRLNELDFVKIVGSTDGTKHIGAISFTVNGIHPHDVASILDGFGVCIRAGHHCAQPLLTYLKVEMGSTSRASVAFYNDKQDIDLFINGLQQVWSIFHG